MRMKGQLWAVVAAVAVAIGCGGGGAKNEPEEVASDVPSNQDVSADVPGVDVPDLSESDLPGQDAADQDTGAQDVVDVAGETLPDPDVVEDVTIPPVGKACEPANRIGRFQVGMKKFGSEFSGRVFDSVDYNGVPTPKESDGECRIVQRKPWFCDPACPPGQQCSDTGSCLPMPAPVNVGLVTVTGLTVPVSVSADAGLNYTFLDFEDAPFLPGDSITLSASGEGPWSAFELAASGVAPLELESNKWELKMQTPFLARWTAGQAPATILISLNVDQHGSTPATLICEVADDGEFEIPAGMVSSLLLYGVNGAPTAYVFRRFVDSIDLDQGCVEFEVYSQVNLVVSTN